RERRARDAGPFQANLDRLSGLQIRRRRRLAVPIHQSSESLRPDDRDAGAETPFRAVEPRPAALWPELDQRQLRRAGAISRAARKLRSDYARRGQVEPDLRLDGA